MRVNIDSVGLTYFSAARNHRILTRIVEVGEVGETGDLRLEDGVCHKGEFGIEVVQVSSVDHCYVDGARIVVDDGVAYLHRDMVGAGKVEVAHIAFVAVGDEQAVIVDG